MCIYNFKEKNSNHICKLKAVRERNLISKKYLDHNIEATREVFIEHIYSWVGM